MLETVTLWYFGKQLYFYCINISLVPWFFSSHLFSANEFMGNVKTMTGELWLNVVSTRRSLTVFAINSALTYARDVLCFLPCRLMYAYWRWTQSWSLPFRTTQQANSCLIRFVDRYAIAHCSLLSAFSTLMRWLGHLTYKTHYRVGKLTAAWQCVDFRQHWLFDNGWQYVSCGQWQLPLSGAPVNKMAVNYHEGETDPSRCRVSSSLWDIFVPPPLPLHIGSAWQARHNSDNNSAIS